MSEGKNIIDNNKNVEPMIKKKFVGRPIQHKFRLSDGRILSYYTFDHNNSDSDKSDDDNHHRDNIKTTTELRDDDINNNNNNDDDNNKNFHPVIHFHGYPGCGIEGSLCSYAAYQKQCQIYSFDRPGFGDSSPVIVSSTKEIRTKSSSRSVKDHHDDNDNDDPPCGNIYMKCVVNDIWEFIVHKQWKSFSVIGVSGGGPFAKAMLQSYVSLLLLQYQQQQQQQQDNQQKQNLMVTNDNFIPSIMKTTTTTTNIPTLVGVSIVAGVHFSSSESGSSEGMMKNNEDLLTICTKNTLFYRCLLRVLCYIQRLTILWLPDKVLEKLSKIQFSSQFPKVDHDAMTQPNVLQVFLSSMKMAFKQSSYSLYVEAKTLFRYKKLYYEDLLLKQWKELHAIHQKQQQQQKTADHDEKNNNMNNTNMIMQIKIPRVTIFHGLLDENVPYSHSLYVHKGLLSGLHNTMKTYDDQGHGSLFVTKSNDYIQSIIPTKIKKNEEQ